MKLREAAEAVVAAADAFDVVGNHYGESLLRNLRAALAEPDDAEEFDGTPIPKPQSRVEGRVVRTVTQPPFAIESEPAEFAPVLAAKDAEIERLKGDLADSRHWQKRHCTESAANGVQSVEHWKKLQLVVSERDALAAQVAELRKFLEPDAIRRWWKFDNYQQPQSGWHDREGFIERIHKVLQEPSRDE